MRRTAVLLWLLVFPGISTSSPPQQKYRTDTDIKASIITRYPIQPGWNRMKVQRVFPNDADQSESHYLSYPTDMCRAGNYLYISDYGLRQVLKLDLKGNYLGSIGRAGQGPGEFSTPSSVAGTVSGEVLVVDGLRIQGFAPQGQLRRTFKLPHMIASLLRDGTGLSVNPLGPGGGASSAALKGGEPLIVRYDLAGKMTGSFGDRIDREGHFSMDSRAYLTFYREQLAVAFKYYPIIRLYDQNGNLVRESRIGIPVLERLEKYNQDKRFTNPVPNVVNLTRSLAGIQAVGERIFVLLHLPRIEIHEIDLSGRDVATFYVDRPTDIVDYAGFVVWEDGPELFAYVVSKSAEDSVLWVLKMGANQTLLRPPDQP